MALSPNQRGALFMVISQVAFILNDTLVKLSSADLGAGQIMAVRGVFASVMIIALTWYFGLLRPLKMAFHPLLVLRVVSEMAATITYLIALAHLPIANVSAVFQSLPLVITMGAALFLDEIVGVRRWSAIAIGFIGILLIVRPGIEGFSMYSIYVLVCVLFCAVRDLTTRYVPDEMPTMFVSMITSISVTVCGFAIIPATGGWQPVSGTVLVMLVASAAMVLTGYQFIIKSVRVGDVSFVAPFRYSNLVWAIIVGIFIFGDIPDLFTIIGSVIIVASGVYSVYRERVVDRTRPIAESTGPSNAADGV